jgi:membrane protein YqaA with SNARE-associated domain
MAEFFIEYGSVGLFLFAFISGTFIPISSEAALLLSIGAGMSELEALVACSAGNCLSCTANYFMGKKARDYYRDKLEKSKLGKRALSWMEKYGVPSLFLSWVPFVGDPLTIAAGIAELSQLYFTLIVYCCRIIRYMVIVQVV